MEFIITFRESHRPLAWSQRSRFFGGGGNTHFSICFSMDRLRLVMPPLLFVVLSYPFTRLAYALFPVAYANGIIAGAFAFYVLYDCLHYALHHTQLPKYIKEMKIYHMA